ncbi:hypothetical protein K402DRAFT_67301 [Aulographum hederae CBS 113979]|uniref:Uncharacterized protein n=1 Tax=Aulographum hederae CBS 113979 TaxID=1176131 RepID=A0A6G1H0S1_9PEZI|nr:hypothetical protein K402DRAFT_67301 [Aulographum hederae CBS 113979]
MAHVVLFGTCNTKLHELLFLHSRILQQLPDATITFIDVGRKPSSNPAINVSHADLLANASSTSDLSSLDRADLLAELASLTTSYLSTLQTQNPFHAIVSAGGSGGTSLASSVMRTLPLGLPKLIVSTVAAGETKEIVGESDIILLPSIVDVAGLNGLLQTILSNAAAAISGMAQAYKQRSEESGKEKGDKKVVRLGITMFGVTTPCVDHVRAFIDEKYPGKVETFVFHATGTGGKAMERLIEEDGLDAVLDLTTTEICDYIAGGNMSAGPDRLEAAAKRSIPLVLSVGACDMVNFGPWRTVPERYSERKLLKHNENVTLMRTNVEENKQVGRFIVERLLQSPNKELVKVWIPRGGVSIVSVPGGPFADEKADEALFTTLQEGLANSGIEMVDKQMAINDEDFARGVAAQILGLVGLDSD